MLVVYHSCIEREDEVAEKMRTMDEDEAREKSEDMFRIVRGEAQRFMTYVSEKEDSAGLGSLLFAEVVQGKHCFRCGSNSNAEGGTSHPPTPRQPGYPAEYICLG